MKTYYDGEERGIISITKWVVVPNDVSRPYWMVVYERAGHKGQLLVQAKDELDAMRIFPAELERLSKNYEDDNNVS